MNKRDEMAWVDYAVCGELGAAPMFPNAEDTYGINAAKANCMRCEVVFQCLGQAMDNNERFGIWGGMTPEEREDFRRTAKRRANRLAKLEAAEAEALNSVAS